MEVIKEAIKRIVINIHREMRLPQEIPGHIRKHQMPKKKKEYSEIKK